VDISLLEHCIREELNKTAQRVMAVLNPLKVIIQNYPEDRVEYLDAINNPEDLSMGTRKVPFSKVIYIERDDFMENPPKNFYRLAPGREVRLRYAYFIRCIDVKKDSDRNIKEIVCTYDPETRGGDAPDGRKVRATLHWVSERHAFEAEIRLYDHLFTIENPMDVDVSELDRFINPESLIVLKSCKLEPSLREAMPGERYQFERVGYFYVDHVDSAPGAPVFNRIVSLKDQWKRIQKANRG